MLLFDATVLGELRDEKEPQWLVAVDKVYLCTNCKVDEVLFLPKKTFAKSEEHLGAGEKVRVWFDQSEQKAMRIEE